MGSPYSVYLSKITFQAHLLSDEAVACKPYAMPETVASIKSLQQQQKHDRKKNVPSSIFRLISLANWPPSHSTHAKDGDAANKKPLCAHFRNVSTENALFVASQQSTGRCECHWRRRKPQWLKNMYDSATLMSTLATSKPMGVEIPCHFSVIYWRRGHNHQR